MNGRETRIGRVGAAVRNVCSFLALVTARAAQGCRTIVEATLHWPPMPANTRWSLLHKGRLYEHTANWILAWPGMVMVSRLIYLCLALGIVLGEVNINIVRIPAVLGLPSGGASTVSLPVTLALLFLAMAAFFGALTLEFWEVVPTNTHLFPPLRPGVQWAFRAIALSGFVLSVVTVGLLYAAGAALLQGMVVPELTIAINLLQGVLLTIVAVPAIWALVLGLLALLALACALLWLALTGLSLLCQALAGARLPDVYDGNQQDTYASIRLARDEWTDPL